MCHAKFSALELIAIVLFFKLFVFEWNSLRFIQDIFNCGQLKRSMQTIFYKTMDYFSWAAKATKPVRSMGFDRKTF